MKLEVTKAQLDAIIQLSGDCEGMIGGGDDDADKAWIRHTKLINRMLINNGIETELSTEE